MGDQTQPDEGFTMPEDLSALSAAELADLESEARAAFDALDGDDVTDEDVDEMERLAGAVQAIEAEGTNREAAAEQRRERAAAARSSIADTTTPEEGDGEDGEGEEGTEGEGEEEPAPGDVEGEEATEPIAASAGKGLAKRTHARTPAGLRSMRRPANPKPRQSSEVVITAGADISGVPNGSRLDDLRAVALAFMARSKGFVAPPPNREVGVFNRYGVATLARPKDLTDGLYDDNPDFGSVQNILDLAKRENRLPGGSLTAAGGWCAPSETLYTLCSNESLDGMVDLPEMTVSRGGIRYTPGPDFADIYAASCFFAQTEAQAIAGTAKNCCEVDCPDFDEIRLDAVGFCVKAPILTRAGYPELVQRWLEGTMIANAHKVNARTINSMATALGAATATFDGQAVTFSTLTALELAGEGVRYKYRMSRNETLEAVAPFWLLTAIRGDLANRTGQPFEAVSDAQIIAHFAARNIAIQFVYDWQDSTFVAAGCVVDFPATVEVLLYPAGTFVKGVQDVISLDTIYDTTDLLSNMYTAAFAEDGMFVAQTCFSGCRLTIPVCVSGRTAAADLTGCYGVEGGGA